MLDPDSRYRDQPIATHTDPLGRPRPWITLRVSPSPQLTVTYRVQAHDRLDTLADRAYGDSTSWWRIADANIAALTGLPHELLDAPDATVQLAQPVKPEVLPR